VSLRLLLAPVLLVAGLLAVGTDAAGPASAGPARTATAATAATAAGGYVAVTSTRLLDTRHGIGARTAAVAANSALKLTVIGAVVPAGAVAVALNVTVVSPQRGGYLTVWGAGDRPTASNLNFSSNQTIANAVITPIDPSDGSVQFYNGAPGTVQVLADVAGYYTAGSPTDAGALHPVTPTRLLDTRYGTGVSDAGPISAGPVRAQGIVSLKVIGSAAIPSGVSAVVLNVTVNHPTTTGYITVWGEGTTRPATSNLNFVANQTVPNLVIAPVASNGIVHLINSSTGTANLIADVSGYFLGGSAPTVNGTLSPVPPTRLLDTRNGIGVPKAAVPAGSTVSFTVTNQAGVAAAGVAAVVLNVTAISATTTGFLTAFASGTARPYASNVNYPRGKTVPNLVIAPVGADGKVAIYADGASGTVQVIADVSAYILGEPTPRAWIPSRLPAPYTGNGDPDVFPSVSCPTSTFCATSNAYGGPNGSTLASLSTYTAGTWTSTALPLPSGAPTAEKTTRVRRVVCVSASACFAAAEYVGPTNVGVPFVASYNGTMWTARKLPLPEDVNTSNSTIASSISCASATWCVVVGTYLTESLHSAAMTVTLAGTVWTARKVAPPADGNATDSALTDVRCSTVGSCTAIGHYNDGVNSTTPAMVLTLSSGVWAAATAPSPAPLAAGEGMTLDAMTCAAANECVMAGGSGSSNTTPTSVIVTQSGSSLSVVAAPTSPGSTLLFTDVRCTAIGSCVAVGTDDETAGALITTLNSGSWTTQALTLPADAATNPDSTSLSSVTCPDTTDSCVAVGFYRTTASAIRGLIATSANGTWTTIAAPLPEPAPGAGFVTSLRDVACSSGLNTCVAVGQAQLDSGPILALTETRANTGS
jgi:hypothetical protein